MSWSRVLIGPRAPIVLPFLIDVMPCIVGHRWSWHFRVRVVRPLSTRVLYVLPPDMVWRLFTIMIGFFSMWLSVFDWGLNAHSNSGCLLNVQQVKRAIIIIIYLGMEEEKNFQTLFMSSLSLKEWSWFSWYLTKFSAKNAVFLVLINWVYALGWQFTCNILHCVAPCIPWCLWVACSKTTSSRVTATL